MYTGLNYTDQVTQVAHEYHCKLSVSTIIQTLLMHREQSFPNTKQKFASFEPLLTGSLNNNPTFCNYL